MEDGDLPARVPNPASTAAPAAPTAAGAAAPATGSATAPSGTVPFRLGNRPPLTGIRALALSTVLIYHSDFKTLPGAWVAIQIFFVLSGFLITAMLSSEGMRNGTVSLKRFYSRRAVRLVPPLVLTVALLAVYAALVHVADASTRLWGDSAAAMFYYADYRQAFGHAPFFGYLAQTWSLSVEEQFYVIWSILLVAAVAVHRRRLAYAFAGVGIVASVADRLWQVYSAAHFYTPKDVAFTRVYYAFDTRADALFLGCLLGLLASDGYLQQWKPWAIRTLTAAAVASTAVLIWTLLEAPLFKENVAVWWLPLSTVASAVVIIYFVMCPAGIASRLVGIGILVFIGDLSYTVYLLHFGVYLAITQGGTHWSYWPTFLLRLAVIFGIAIASWYLIEKPLSRWRERSAAR